MKKYKVGYCPGAFDLFHVGHLNLLRKAKEHCDYLIAGVVTDEAYEGYKIKKPVISFEERYDIVNALKCVDETIGVTPELMDKMVAWERYGYDCHFAGSDHVNHWENLKIRFKELGVDMMFFDYTQSTSSTRIRTIIEQEALFRYMFSESANKRIVVYGAGKDFDNFMCHFGNRYVPTALMDGDNQKWGKMVHDLIVQKPEELLLYDGCDVWIIICCAQSADILLALNEAGVNAPRYIYQPV